LVKYITMLYQWQLVKNKVIQCNFPGNFHDNPEYPKWIIFQFFGLYLMAMNKQIKLNFQWTVTLIWMFNFISINF
jgi:hypothetical protein